MPDSTERLKAAVASRYALAHERGSGGMAVVYLARDQRSDRDVALKVRHRVAWAPPVRWRRARSRPMLR
jgi:serine/threonine protein kinase